MEIWKEIKGYEGLYEVSSEGRVRNVRTNRILKQNRNYQNYLQTNLYKNGVKKTYYTHVIVKNTFDINPDPEHLTQINHINEIKDDNRLENLEFCTPKYNSNYGHHIQNMFDTNIKNGHWNPERCGIDEKERRKKYHQEHYQKNRDKILEQNKVWRDAHKEKFREYTRKHREKLRLGL